SPAGLLSGTPLEAGYFFPSGRVADALGNARDFGFFSRVSAGTPKTLDVDSIDTPFLTLNRESSYALSVGASGKSPYTWSITGALPPGMTKQDDANGKLTFWGVPKIAGAYPVTVRATDADGNAAIRLITLRVTPLYGDSRRLPDG